MYYIEIGKTRIPKLGLGTWQLEGHAAREVVETAIELGYRHIDTAQAYHNEAEVGAAVMASDLRREDFFVTTKVDYSHLAHDQVLKSVDQSLERLGTGYVDLLLIHWPNESVPLRETLLAFEEIRREGRTRHIGVSNFPPGMLKEARELAPILCEQVEYHVYLQQRNLQRYAQQNDLLLTAYCPLARGKVADDEVLREIGQPHAKSPQQVALRWLIQQPQVAAIPKSSSREHLASNIDIFDFSLTPDEMERIAQLDHGERLIDPDFAPAWNR
jgi:2,5-diketo-D-gluconate reductase B